MIHLHSYWPLFLLAALVPLFRTARKPTGREKKRKGIVIALATLCLFCLVGALCQPILESKKRQLSLVSLVDMSESVSQEQRQQAQAILRRLTESLSEQDRLTVATFGENTSVTTHWDSPTDPLGSLSLPTTAQRATSIEDALKTAVSVLAGASGRLVLFSDGLENRGDVKRVLPWVRASGVAVDVVPLSEGESPEVVLTEVHCPTSVPLDTGIPFRVSVKSTESTRIRLQIDEGGLVLKEQMMDLGRGVQLIEMSLPPASAGSHRYHVRVFADRDDQPANNTAIAQVEVGGAVRILYVTATDKSVLSALLSGAVLHSPEQLPLVPAGYTDYQVLVLDNVPVERLSSQQILALSEAVRIGGMGLVVLGSKSLGPGGYLGTPLEDLLPVTLTPPEKQRPKVVILVVDRSGSMGGRFGRDTKIELARSAVASAIRALRPEDEVGVLAFDAQAHELVPRQKVELSLRWIRRLAALDAGHGTRMQPALEQAAAWFKESELERRYLVLLSDGKVPEDDHPAEVVEQLRQQQVQTSSISFGNSALMQQLAQIGSGRYHVVTDLSSLPNVLVEEIRQTEESVRTGVFTPLRIQTDPVVMELDNWPPVYGYIRGQLREGAHLHLTIAASEPLLASWQYGTGHTLVFLSDLTSTWGRDWLRWVHLRRFARQMVDTVKPNAEPDEISVIRRGTEAFFESSVPVTKGEILDPSGGSQEISFKMQNGLWVGIADITDPGDYIATVHRQHFAIPVAYPPELADVGVDESLLRYIADQTGGRFRPTIADMARRPYVPSFYTRELWRLLLWIGMIFFIASIAARHLSLRRSLSRHVPAVVEATLGTMTRLQAMRHMHRTSLANSQPQALIRPKDTNLQIPQSAPTSPSPEASLTHQLLALKQRRRG